MDAIDHKIIELLQQNARITNVELAKANSMAPSSMLDRVRRLEERGVIKGYTTLLDPLKIGVGLEAIVMICLGRHQERSIDTFEDSVCAIPEVRACWHVAGRYDYALLVAVRDIEHLGELIKRELSSIPGIEKQETFLTLSTVKEDRGIAIPAPELQQEEA
jgi:Lrp/AsnC family transcriptional regulator, leucine-responsive regulatory protein